MQNTSRELRHIGRFIRAMREATPASGYGSLAERRRHVDHLTQNDLADLIGMSVVVVSQIEQGRYLNLSRLILHRIAESLSLTERQSQYLLGLFDERPTNQLRPGPSPEWLVTSINQIAHPVLILNPGYDVAAINPKAQGFFGDMSPHLAPTRNAAFAVFQLPGMRTFLQDWLPYVSSVVSGIHMNFATFPAWREYIEEVAAKLASVNPEFSRLWNQDAPLVRPTIDKVFHHPNLGTMNAKQILTDIIEAPGLTRVEFIPGDDDARRKFSQL